MRCPGTPLLPLLLLPAAAAAQALQWDVPHRGALTYERRTERWLVTPPPSRLRTEWLVRDAEHGGHEWRYLACPLDHPPAGFEAPGFDDSDWSTGRGEFTPDAGKGPSLRTPWKTGTIVLRSKVDFGKRKPRAVVLRSNHDDGMRVFCNGKLVFQNDSAGRDFLNVLTGDVLAAFQNGDNVLAVECDNTHGGAQYVDLGIAFVATLPPGVKTGDDVLKILASDRDAANGVARELFGEYRPPPLLLQGELDAEQTRVAIAPGDLREIAWWVAMDLQKAAAGGAFSIDAPRLYRLGDLQIRGRVQPLDADGWQDLDLTVKSPPELDAAGDSKRFLQMFVRPHVLYNVDARLKVRRKLALDGGRARVVEFRTELSGRLLRGKEWKEHAADLEQVETWTLHGEHKNQDSAFRASVAEALKKGIAHLRSDLADVNRDLLKSGPADGPNSYNSGRLALGLLALIKGGVSKKDEVLQRGLEALRKRPLIDTYSLGCAIMSLEAYYAPDDEWKHLREGAIDRPGKRTLPAEDKQIVDHWTTQLLQNIDTRVDPAYLLRFNYTRGERYDHSVNQYGLLGLYSAHLCGVEIAPQVWEAAANHLIASETEPAPKSLDLDLVDYRTLARTQGDYEHKRTGTRAGVRPAGWNYGDPRDGGEIAPVWGSMTCAGITGLAICQAALLDQGGQKRVKLQNDATAARNAGFAWLAQHLTVRCHPGVIFRQQQWLYYYLYGLERAALLSGIALLQDHDWYFEGAMVLVHAQKPDGSWPAELHWDQGIERDAMAILFLKQSTLPVLTGQ
jgi:hypothetical protein